ncbi:KIR-like protein [Plasmodium coatneyi]|uniref:KIR-like protein n=1 Tax=Plasmodium coatneyi TaxID=208452 RepID=A0A1B1E6Y6_9APIC|nr:KIR-like protein [Plasmodium coatneyi]ANQ10529.1 KIR-like protein [Plasmodium coatneyi]
MNAGLNYNNIPCDFFYYWVGDTFWNNLGGHTLSNLLDKIYSTLSTLSYGTKCNIKYEGTDERTVKQRKTLFDYSFDYNTIEKDLLEKDDPNCNSHWISYRLNVSTVCKAVKQSCEKKYDSDEYCKKFKAQYRVYCDAAEFLNSYCNSKIELASARATATADAQEASLAAEEKLRSTTTTASITSIITTLAATVVPFLLYKYKPWSSWFSKHTSGNGGRSNRRRRSIGGDIDTLTENDSRYDSTDTSTIGPTENSTLGPGAYNTRQISGRRNNNAGGRGMVGYHNM